MSGNFLYSANYRDEIYEYRHVVVPSHLVDQVPSTRLMTETEWRNLGVRQSPGWIHFMRYDPVIFGLPQYLIMRNFQYTKYASEWSLECGLLHVTGCCFFSNVCAHEKASKCKAARPAVPPCSESYTLKIGSFHYGRPVGWSSCINCV